MNSIIVAIVYAILSVIVIIVTKSAANKRIEKKQINTDLDEYKIVPYKVSPGTVLVALVLVAISAGCGYVVSNEIDFSVINSTISTIALGSCYFATLAAAVIDLKTRTIPNYISITIVGIRLLIFIYELFCVEEAIGSLISSLIGALLCAFMLIFANKLSRGGIGGGDIKLLSSIGFMCGMYMVFSTMLIALIGCIIFSTVGVLLKKRMWKDHLAFGPYIYIGFVVMCLFRLY